MWQSSPQELSWLDFQFKGAWKLFLIKNKKLTITLSWNSSQDNSEHGQKIITHMAKTLAQEIDVDDEHSKM